MSKKPQATAETNTGKQTLVPKLRFPEFRNAPEWQEKELGKVAEVLQGFGFPEKYQGKPNGEYPFYKVSDISNSLQKGGYFIKEAANYVDGNTLRALKAKLIPVGSTIFAKIGEAIRLNRRVITSVPCLIDNNVAGLKRIEGEAVDSFVHYTFSQISLEDYSGGAVPSVNKSTLENISIACPNILEQQKIADCLSSLDELITAQVQKFEALKMHKKGLMQLLFPAEGETIPKLRFLEFRNASEWKPVSLKDVCNMQSGKFIAANGIYDACQAGMYPCYGGNGLRGYTKTHNTSGKFPLIGRQGALCGNVNLVDGDYYATEHALVARPETGVNVIWLYYLLDLLNLNKFATGQAQPGLSVDVLQKVPAPMPSNEREQQKIADCLSWLDELIEAQTQKVEALKAHKKGLMQQLFPPRSNDSEC